MKTTYLSYCSQMGPFIDDLHHYHHDRDSFMALIAPLNVPWHPTKTGDCFIPIFTFIGFLWDLIHKRVSLPEPKCLKFLDRVFILIMKADNHEKISLLDVQKIHGSLVHICFIHLDGNSRLPCLSNFMSSFEANEFAQHYIPNSIITALQWWHHCLSDPLYFRHFLRFKILAYMSMHPHLGALASSLVNGGMLSH